MQFSIAYSLGCSIVSFFSLYYLCYIAAVPPQKELGSLSYSRPPAQAAASWDGANLAPPSAWPRLACAAKDSRTQDTELLICEDSGC